MLNVATVLALSSDTNPLIPEAGELVVGAAAFLIVFALLAKVSFPRIQQTYAERTDRIEGGIKRAEEAQAEAQRTLEEYRQQLSEARHEATQIREEAMADAAARRREIEADARQQADEMLARAQDQIDASRQQALLSLRAEVGRLSVQLAERIVNGALEEDARQRTLVDDFLASLEADDSAGSTAGAGQAG